jgi:hypothetical protein
MNIQSAPHGINLVIETDGTRVYIGRFDSTNGFTALLHDCDVHDVAEGEDAEAYIRETARYGVNVTHRDVQVEVAGISRIRLLGDVPKPD